MFGAVIRYLVMLTYSLFLTTILGMAKKIETKRLA